jgi:hypothetical protein
MASFSFVLPSFSAVGPASVVPSASSPAVRRAAARAVSLRPFSELGGLRDPGRLSFPVCSCSSCSVAPTAGWCASRRTLLVSVSGSAPVECRTEGVPSAEVSTLVAGLREAVESGELVSLVAHGSWSPYRFFCGFVPLG